MNSMENFCFASYVCNVFHQRKTCTLEPSTDSVPLAQYLSFIERHEGHDRNDIHERHERHLSLF